jgi:hypothetical protein
VVRSLAVGSTLLIASAGVLAWQQRTVESPQPTRLIHYTAPVALPAEAIDGACAASLVAGAYRDDALRCGAGGAEYDPCFRAAREGYVLCNADPRKDGSGRLVRVASTKPPGGESGGSSRAWFIELADGTTCRAIVGVRREVEGETEVYTCAFANPGESDAVLGDLDTSTPVWTIARASLNKKVEPQTIKSVMVVTVKTAWQ